LARLKQRKSRSVWQRSCEELNLELPREKKLISCRRFPAPAGIGHLDTRLGGAAA
jgi:hypothetical protein